MASFSSSQGFLVQAMKILTQGMKNSSLRTRIAAENLTNAESTGVNSGDDPYIRKKVTFQEVVDQEIGTSLPVPSAILRDTSTEFKIIYRPSHPAADANGNVKMPNVEPFLEMFDFQEASIAHQAYTQLYALSTSMLYRTHDLMKQN